MTEPIAISSGLLLGALFIMLLIMLCAVAQLFYMRITMLQKQERYYWILGASGMYIFEYDEETDELTLSAPFASILGIPKKITQASQVIEHTKDKTMRRGLSYISKIMRTEGLERLEIEVEGVRGVFNVCYNNFADKNSQSGYHIGILTDVTSDIIAEENLRSRAERDGLTMIYNSETIKTLVANELKTRDSNTHSAFVMLDVDHFKTVNDTYGHQAGDEVLRRLALKLKCSIRESDMLGRLGGDEFCIYLKRIPSYSFLYEFCKRLNQAARTIHIPAPDNRDAPNISISIGGVIVLRDEKFTDIYSRADKMLYRAKKEGRDTYSVTP